jgi:hypothetical protein
MMFPKYDGYGAPSTSIYSSQLVRQHEIRPPYGYTPRLSLSPIFIGNDPAPESGSVHKAPPKCPSDGEKGQSKTQQPLLQCTPLRRGACSLRIFRVSQASRSRSSSLSHSDTRLSGILLRIAKLSCSSSSASFSSSASPSSSSDQ